MANRFWEQFNQGLSTGQKIWEADADRRLRKELADAARVAPSQQTLGVNAPAAGAVPVGYEDYIQAQQGGGFAPREATGLTPADMEQRRVIAERFNQPTAFQGEQTSYSLGGLTQDRPFTRDEVVGTRRRNMADIYARAGDVEKSEAMMERADQAELRGIQLNEAKRLAGIEAKKQDLLEEQANVRRNLKVGTDSIFEQMRLGNLSEMEGAKLVQDFYNNNIPNGFNLEIADNKMWHQDPKDPNKKVGVDITRKNVMEAFKDLPSILDKAYDDRMNALTGNLKGIRDAARADEALGIQQRGLGLQERGVEQKDVEIKNAMELGQERLGLLKKELKLKELTIPSEIEKNRSQQAYANLSMDQIRQKMQKESKFDSEVSKITQDLEAGKLSPQEAQRKINMASVKLGGQLRETKSLTAADLKNIEETATLRYPNLSTMPIEKQQEIRDDIKSELGFSSGSGALDIVKVAAGDKGDKADKSAKPATGLQKPITRDLFTSDAAYQKALAEQKADQQRKAATRDRLNKVREEAADLGLQGPYGAYGF